MFDPIKVYWAFITRVINADTFVASIDLGFHVSVTETFRVSDYDAPETFRPRNAAERKHGSEASYVAHLLLNRNRLLIITAKKQGKYGRYIADVVIPQEASCIKKDVAEQLSEVMVGPVTGYYYSAYMKAAGFSKRDSYAD